MVQNTACCKIKKKKCCHTLQLRTCNKRTLAYEANHSWHRFLRITHTHTHMCACARELHCVCCTLRSIGQFRSYQVYRRQTRQFPPINIITVTFTIRHKPSQYIFWFYFIFLNLFLFIYLFMWLSVHSSMCQPFQLAVSSFYVFQFPPPLHGAYQPIL
jgi:hypothetical protein